MNFASKVAYLVVSLVGFLEGDGTFHFGELSSVDPLPHVHRNLCKERKEKKK
jgi:hypothetical protein